MSQYTEVVERAGESVLSAVKAVQEATVSAVERVSKTVGEVLPELPAVPLADRLPRPVEVVETGFGLASRFLRQSHSWAKELAAALEPLTGKLLGPQGPAGGGGARKPKAKAEA